MKVLRSLFGSAAALALAGCAPAPIVLNYAPSSTMTVQGNESVAGFAYVPAANGKVKANQIRNTAIGNVYLEKNVGEYFKQAFFTESRFVGIHVNGGPAVTARSTSSLSTTLGTASTGRWM